MRRLRLPQGTVGRDYILLQLKIKDLPQVYDFMVDTGEADGRSALDIPKTRFKLEQGLTAGGVMEGADLVELKDARLVGAEWLPLPPQLAVVTDFLQASMALHLEHLDPEHDPVEGMIGMELLKLFDTDFDFPAGRIRLYRPGEGLAAAQVAGLVEVPAAVLNDTGILGIRVTSPEGAARGKQPFVGLLDCGASFSAINWQAAALAGLPPRGDPAYGVPGQPTQGVAIVGVDGKPQTLPITEIQVTFVGDVSRGGDGGLSFAPPPAGWRPWAPVQVAVGELPAFAQLLSRDGKTPFKGPAMLVGLDVLSQRRVVIGAGYGKEGRARQLYVGPSYIPEHNGGAFHAFLAEVNKVKAIMHITEQWREGGAGPLVVTTTSHNPAMGDKVSVSGTARQTLKQDMVFRLGLGLGKLAERAARSSFLDEAAKMPAIMEQPTTQRWSLTRPSLGTGALVADAAPAAAVPPPPDSPPAPAAESPADGDVPEAGADARAQALRGGTTQFLDATSFLVRSDSSLRKEEEAWRGKVKKVEVEPMAAALVRLSRKYSREGSGSLGAATGMGPGAGGKASDKASAKSGGGCLPCCRQSPTSP
eukprot:scaffold16.g88.t1